MIDYLIAKCIHIIFVVSYFAGLFYMVRLFIYHTEALEKEDPERSILHKQFSFMEEHHCSRPYTDGALGHLYVLRNAMGVFHSRVDACQTAVHRLFAMVSLLFVAYNETLTSRTDDPHFCAIANAQRGSNHYSFCSSFCRCA